MPRTECRERGSISRGRTRFFALLFLTLGTLAPWARTAHAQIVPPDQAARLYEQGRKAVKRGDYRAGIDSLEKALATGHATPVERLGTTRAFADHYDPYYWLGVARMELGQEARAKDALERSRSFGVISAWPESTDLESRLRVLETRAAERAAAASAARPEPTPLPLPPATPTPAPPPLAPRPTPTPELVPTAAPPAPELPTATPLPFVTPTSEERRNLVAAVSAADFELAATLVDRLRARGDTSPDVDLLDCVTSVSQFLLEGRKDEALLARARRALRAYRAKGGNSRAEAVWISPAMSAVLGTP
ncbi:MAG: hypothetical protein JNK60_05535 [Acidobacteria bacterium]|nr:hypothetical protein [Acidobacteriota bacterium]